MPGQNEENGGQGEALACLFYLKGVEARLQASGNVKQ